MCVVHEDIWLIALMGWKWLAHAPLPSTFGSSLQRSTSVRLWPRLCENSEPKNKTYMRVRSSGDCRCNVQKNPLWFGVPSDWREQNSFHTASAESRRNPRVAAF
jgi:hypothetical protein